MTKAELQQRLELKEKRIRALESRLKRAKDNASLWRYRWERDKAAR